MVAYSRCEYTGLSPKSVAAIDAARGERTPWTGNNAIAWRNRGKCPLTPNETSFILKALAIPTNTNIYLAAGDGLLELEGFTSAYTKVYTKSSFLDRKEFASMHGNTKAALDYHVSIHSDGYIATYFGNMDKMVSAMRSLKGMEKTLFLSRRAFANCSAMGVRGQELAYAMWRVHLEDFVMERGYALPDCFCEFRA
ncbi:hypothetical protein HPP92_025017 [Vanilla planifolia]|uniref:O-fucosyltransferase family protein n=1 Tax=Vanilla planifolia TaxID=51239 RepID=A0A835UA09_VANPL|nr:hypothetical protein HPP92_025017 [Vanilla planifolia]